MIGCPQMWHGALLFLSLSHAMRLTYGHRFDLSTCWCLCLLAVHYAVCLCIAMGRWYCLCSPAPHNHEKEAKWLCVQAWDGRRCLPSIASLGPVVSRPLSSGEVPRGAVGSCPVSPTQYPRPPFLWGCLVLPAPPLCKTAGYLLRYPAVWRMEFVEKRSLRSCLTLAPLAYYHIVIPVWLPHFSANAFNACPWSS